MHEAIKLMLFDVDGVLTDGAITLDDQGIESKRFHVRDGSGIKMLQRLGIATGVLTGRTSRVVEHRAQELGMEVLRQGALDKLAVFDDILEERGLQTSEVAYMGDDLLDLPVLRRAGLSFAPADAHPLVLEMVTHVTRLRGGRGAAREAIELLIQARGQWDQVMERYDR